MWKCGTMLSNFEWRKKKLPNRDQNNLENPYSIDGWIRGKMVQMLVSNPFQFEWNPQNALEHIT